MSDPESDPQVIVQGYTRDRHWETVYHDMADLYGPMIGPDGIGLWFTYKRFVQNDPAHLLNGMAWPSHRKRLAKLYHTSPNTLRAMRQKLQQAGLITVTPGRELVRGSDEEFELQTAIRHVAGKPQRAVRRISLGDLARLGIQNPANSLFIAVHDPLPLYGFCEAFELTYYPEVNRHDSQGAVWDMEFEDYPGIIQGPNRILAAIRYITDNLDLSPNDRYYWPLVSAQQIRSLLRCKEDEREIVTIRDHLLERQAALVDQGVSYVTPEDADRSWRPRELWQSPEDRGARLS